MAGKKTPEIVKQARELYRRSLAVIDTYERAPHGKRYTNACEALETSIDSAVRALSDV